MPAYEAYCESGGFSGDVAARDYHAIPPHCTITIDAHSEESHILPRRDHLEHVVGICETVAVSTAVKVQYKVRGATSHVRHVCPSMW